MTCSDGPTTIAYVVQDEVHTHPDCPTRANRLRDFVRRDGGDQLAANTPSTFSRISGGAIRRQLVLTPEEFDFGCVGQQESHVAEFETTNTFDIAVTLKDPVLGCACQSASIEQKCLQPGHSTKAKIMFNTGATRGRIRYPVELIAALEDGQRTGARASMTAEVLPDIVMSADKITFSKTSGPSQTVEFTAGQATQFAIRSHHASHSCLLVNRDPQNANRFAIALDVSKLTADPTATYWVMFETDSRKEPTLALAVFVRD